MGLLCAQHRDVGLVLGHISPFPWAQVPQGCLLTQLWPPWAFPLLQDALGTILQLPQSSISQVPLAGQEHLCVPRHRCCTRAAQDTAIFHFSSLQEQAEPFRGDRMQVSARQEQHKSISHCLKIYLYTRSEPLPPESCGRNGVLKCSIIYS